MCQFFVSSVDGIDRHLEKQAVKRKRKKEREDKKKILILET